MANNPNTPFGGQPYQHNGGVVYRAQATVYSVAANTTNAMFLGDPVIKVTASADATHGYDAVNLATATSNNKITGFIVGFLGTDPNGALFGTSGAPGPYYKATNSPVLQYVLVDDDAKDNFIIQCTGTPAATVVGRNTNLVSGNGSVYTGWSGMQCSATTGTSSTAQLRIIGFAQEVDNVIGNKFPKLIVNINNSTEAAGTGI